jgi:hypothetical protein
MKCEFEFVCNKQWYELVPIDVRNEDLANPQIRYCTTCSKDVHRVETEDELRKAIKAGLCVSVGRFDFVKIKWLKKLIENSRTTGMPRRPID